MWSLYFFQVKGPRRFPNIISSQLPGDKIRFVDWLEKIFELDKKIWLVDIR